MSREILLDIEGTTTPIQFVTGVLFPFAREHVDSYVRRHRDSPALRALIAELRRERDADEQGGLGPPAWPKRHADSVIDYARWLIDRDRKSTPLKALQGKIWEEGYRSGLLAGQVFDDVPPAFERWTANGDSIWIFSSGSVLAQKLLFSHCPQGDLTRFLSGYFDTSTGPKQSPNSYTMIAAACGRPADAMLFVSDVSAELDAAKAAGMEARLSVRAGNPAQPDHGHRVLESFAAL